MTDLRQAAMQALEAWDDPMGMKDLCVAMDALRKVLAQPEQQAEPFSAVSIPATVTAWKMGYEAAKAEMQPEQEPCIGKDPRCPCQDGGACHYKDCVGTKARTVAQPEQEPVISAWSLREVYFDEDGEPSMHRSPPAAPSEWPLIKNILAEYGLDAIAFVAEWKAAQRQWVGLTDNEIDSCWYQSGGITPGFARTVEAKLKEKNDH